MKSNPHRQQSLDTKQRTLLKAYGSFNFCSVLDMSYKQPVGNRKDRYRNGRALGQSLDTARYATLKAQPHKAKVEFLSSDQSVQVLTSKNLQEGQLLESYQFNKGELPPVASEHGEMGGSSRDEHLQVLTDNYRMPSTLDNYKGTRNSFLPQTSFFDKPQPVTGIGEKLSPGRYKLIQGRPDLTKRNQSHFSTFNESKNPLSWSKKLTGKLQKQLIKQKEEVQRSSRFPAIHVHCHSYEQSSLEANDYQQTPDESVKESPSPTVVSFKSINTSRIHSSKKKENNVGTRKFRISKHNVRNLFSKPAEPTIEDLHEAKQRLNLRLKQILSKPAAGSHEMHIDQSQASFDPTRTQNQHSEVVENTDAIQNTLDIAKKLDEPILKHLRSDDHRGSMPIDQDQNQLDEMKTTGRKMTAKEQRDSQQKHQETTFSPQNELIEYEQKVSPHLNLDMANEQEQSQLLAEIHEQQKDLFSKITRKVKIKCKPSLERLQLLNNKNKRSSSQRLEEDQGFDVSKGTFQDVMMRGTMQRDQSAVRQSSVSQLLSSMKQSKHQLQAFVEMMSQAHSKAKMGNTSNFDQTLRASAAALTRKQSPQQEISPVTSRVPLMVSGNLNTEGAIQKHPESKKFLQNIKMGEQGLNQQSATSTIGPNFVETSGDQSIGFFFQPKGQLSSEQMQDMDKVEKSKEQVPKTLQVHEIMQVYNKVKLHKEFCD